MIVVVVSLLDAGTAVSAVVESAGEAADVALVAGVSASIESLYLPPERLPVVTIHVSACSVEAGLALRWRWNLTPVADALESSPFGDRRRRLWRGWNPAGSVAAGLPVLVEVAACESVRRVA